VENDCPKPQSPRRGRQNGCPRRRDDDEDDDEDEDEDDLRRHTLSARPQRGAITAYGAYAKHIPFFRKVSPRKVSPSTSDKTKA